MPGTAARFAPCRGHSSCVNHAIFSPDGRKVASTSDDGSAKIWDLDTGEELLALRGHRGIFQPAAFSPDGRTLVTAGFDGAVKLWDAMASPESLTLTASESPVLVTKFSPDGRTLITAGADRRLTLWEMPSGRLKATWSGHGGTIWGVAFSPDGKYVASAAGDWQKTKELGEVNIWDAKTGASSARSGPTAQSRDAWSSVPMGGGLLPAAASGGHRGRKSLSGTWRQAARSARSPI